MGEVLRHGLIFSPFFLNQWMWKSFTFPSRVESLNKVMRFDQTTSGWKLVVADSFSLNFEQVVTNNGSEVKEFAIRIVAVCFDCSKIAIMVKASIRLHRTG